MEGWNVIVVWECQLKQEKQNDTLMSIERNIKDGK